MTDNLHCTDCQERLEEFALDELAGGDRAQIIAHLASGCPECNGRLAEVAETLALVAQTIPQTAPPARLERELLARVAADPNQLQREPAADSQSFRSAWIAAAMALAATLACVAFWLSRTPPQSTVAGDWANLERRILAAQQREQPRPRAQLKFVSRQSDATTDSLVSGHVVVDQLAHQCHVFIQSLPPLAADREYRLWFALANGGYLSAGSVQPDADGNVGTLLELPTSGAPMIGFGVSSENVSDPEKPSPDLEKPSPDLLVAPL